MHSTHEGGQPSSADGGWTTLFDDTFDVPGEAALPTTFSLAPGASENQTARIRAIARKGGVAVDLREVIVDGSHVRFESVAPPTITARAATARDLLGEAHRGASLWLRGTRRELETR